MVNGVVLSSQLIQLLRRMKLPLPLRSLLVLLLQLQLFFTQNMKKLNVLHQMNSHMVNVVMVKILKPGVHAVVRTGLVLPVVVLVLVVRYLTNMFLYVNQIQMLQLDQLYTMLVFTVNHGVNYQTVSLPKTKEVTDGVMMLLMIVVVKFQNMNVTILSTRPGVHKNTQ